MEFTPASQHKKKPVTKKHLQKIRANFGVEKAVNDYTAPKTEEEKKQAQTELDDVLDFLD